MPLVDFDSQETWDAMYSEGYVRPSKDRIMGNDGISLVAGAWLWQFPRILIVGSGFGWFGELLVAAGWQVTCLDTSAWIHANKAQNAVLPIHNLNVLTDHSAISALGPFDLILTEDIIACLSDQEAIQLAEACRQFGPVLHWTSVGPPDILNFKPLEAWKALLTPDHVARRGTSEVI